jgi:hypothetical protein
MNPRVPYVNDRARENLRIAMTRRQIGVDRLAAALPDTERPPRDSTARRRVRRLLDGTTLFDLDTLAHFALVLRVDMGLVISMSPAAFGAYLTSLGVGGVVEDLHNGLDEPQGEVVYG